jgi:transcription elongation factor Elf1
MANVPYKYPEKRREHHRLYMRAWYRRNKTIHVERVTDRRRRMREWYEQLKRELACVRCGERHPACIEFHHREPTQKEFDISAARRGEYSMERLLAEIAKCDALCANCHLKLHWEMRQVKQSAV